MIQFKRPDGKTCPGYLAPPKAGSSAPGFVVIQEWCVSVQDGANWRLHEAFNDKLEQLLFSWQEMSYLRSIT
jgi:hypothetical protein